MLRDICDKSGCRCNQTPPLLSLDVAPDRIGKASRRLQGISNMA